MKLAIMQGNYKPRDRLVERELAGQFGVSRIPVRAAIRKLENMGMVRTIPHQGARVADFTPQEIDALYQVRIHLEQLAANLACACVVPKQAQDLMAINQELVHAASSSDFPKLVEGNVAFHRTLAECSGNPFLIRAVEELRTRCYPISYYFWKNRKNIRVSIADHKKMIEALRKKDSLQLSMLVERHLIYSKSSYLNYLSQFPRFHYKERLQKVVVAIPPRRDALRGTARSSRETASLRWK